jgi:hypothetical protein
MAALAVICIAIWCSVYDRWNADDWRVPVEYGLNPAAADVKGVLSGFRAAQDGNFFPGVFHYEPRLNAPFVANWNDSPMTEDVMIWGTGILARVIGFFPAANFLLLFAQMLAVLAFYYAARQMGCGWTWSAAAALLYGLAPYAFAHSLHHVDIACYWHIPPDLLVCFWAANGNGLRFRTRHYSLALALAIITGLQNVYYTNIFIQLMGISLVIQWIRHGRRDLRAYLPPLSIMAAAFGAFFVLAVRAPVYGLLHGHNLTATVRNYAQMEFYGLKLLDFFIPFPTHRIASFASLGERYQLSTILPAETPPACYFGLAGIAAFLWLAVYTVRCAIARPVRRIPLEAVQVLWVFFYGVVGGINGFIGMMNFQLFRSTTRFCIVILAVALLFAIRRLSLISRRWGTPWAFVAPLVIGFFAIWEILPTTAGEPISAVAAQVNSDRVFAQAMESKFPKGMIFQLPVMDFPESPIPGLSAYDHFRPYLYTQDLRFSFGTDKGRPQNAWQRVILGMSPAEQIAALEKYGFSGIYINRAAYSDGGQKLLDQYKAAGRGDVIESVRQDLACVALKPSPNPVLPPPGPFFATGWYVEQDSEEGQRVHIATAGKAYLQLANPTNGPVVKYANFLVAAMAPRLVKIEGAGAYQSWHVDQRSPAKVTNLRLSLEPGDNQVVFSTEAPPTMQQIGPITFYVVNFDLSDSPKPEE